MDECEPALMGKNLTGVKDSYIMLYIYKRQNVLFLCKLNSLDFCRGRRCKTLSVLQTLAQLQKTCLKKSCECTARNLSKLFNKASSQAQLHFSRWDVLMPRSSPKGCSDAQVIRLWAWPCRFDMLTLRQMSMMKTSSCQRAHPTCQRVDCGWGKLNALKRKNML